jgi:hypothetical protein
VCPPHLITIVTGNQADLNFHHNADTLQLSAQRADKTQQMAYANSITPISLNDKVRFKEERLSVLTTPDRKRLEGRVGVVQSYWNFTKKLTVYFPEEIGRPELRILSVDPRQLEQVAKTVIQTEIASEIADAASGNDKLSQEDTDKLFG